MVTKPSIRGAAPATCLLVRAMTTEPGRPGGRLIGTVGGAVVVAMSAGGIRGAAFCFFDLEMGETGFKPVQESSRCRPLAGAKPWRSCCMRGGVLLLARVAAGT